MEARKRSQRFSLCVCNCCGRSIIGLPYESQQFGITPAVCTDCHRELRAREVAKQIQDKRSGYRAIRTQR